MKNVLLVEDNKEIVPLVEMAISRIASVEWAKTLSEAENKLDDGSFDLILLDLQLPDGNGIDLCSKILAVSPTTPIFILTASDDLSQKVLGFTAGADDYITKPFEALELKARIEAKFTKQDLLTKELKSLKWKELEIVQSKQEVTILKDDKLTPIDLTALEYKLLTYLAERPGEVLKRDVLLNDIWGENIYVYPRSVDTHISKLRKKLGDVSEIIESVHGVGYKFVPTEV